jgi:hypothetical protein
MRTARCRIESASMPRVRPSITALLVLLFAAWNCRAADSVPDALTKRLATLSGADAIDCGTLLRDADRRPAIACATDAMASGKPWRLAEQLEGKESSIWQGGVRDSQGKVRVVFFEADLAGAPGSGPTVSVLLCRDIVFAVKGGDAMECQPMPGGP